MKIEYKADGPSSEVLKLDGKTLGGVASINITQFAGDFPTVTLNISSGVEVDLTVDTLKFILQDGKTVTFSGVQMKVE